MTQAAGGGITRIGKDFFSFRQPLDIELLEIAHGDDDLATHLQYTGPTLAMQTQGYALDGAYIAGDILTRLSVAACTGLG